MRRRGQSVPRPAVGGASLTLLWLPPGTDRRMREFPRSRRWRRYAERSDMLIMIGSRNTLSSGGPFPAKITVVGAAARKETVASPEA